jgi:ATP-dependent Clp protease ATP-binding subunit ClpC
VDQINVNLAPKQIKIKLAEGAARYVLEKTCTDRNYGARPLRRALQKYIEDPLSDALIQGSLARPSELEVYLSDTGIFCRQIKDGAEEEGEPVGAGAETAGTPLYMF